MRKAFCSEMKGIVLAFHTKPCREILVLWTSQAPDNLFV